MFAAAALIAMAGFALAQVSNVKRIDLQRSDKVDLEFKRV
jgi:hypothetical protein